MINRIFHHLTEKANRLTLRVKLAALAVFGLAFTMAAWGFIQLSALENILVEQQAKRIEGVAETVSTFYEHFPTRRGIATLDSTLKDFLQSDVRLARIDIFDVRGKRVNYVAGASRVQYDWEDAIIARASAGKKSRYIKIRTEGGTALGLLYPMPGQTQRSRVVVAVITFTRANTEILGRAQQLLIVSSVGLLAVILLVFALSYGWLIGRPLKSMMDTIDESQKGRYIKRVEMNRRDEWGQLADHFNMMAHEIQEVMSRNVELTRHLEDRVREETLKVVQLQNQVDNLKRLTALGHLTATLAHDLGTPLHSIAGLAKLLLEKEDLLPDTAHKLHLIVDQTRRLDHVIQNVRRATRLPDPHFELMTIQEILADTLPLIEPLTKKNRVDIDVRLDSAPESIYADRYRIQTVVLNILQNSLDAMPQGGKIFISARTDGHHFMTLSLADTGKGIAADDLQKVCEPFYSSHPEEGMRGLGLAIVRDIMTSHGGRVEIQSTPGQGTTVTLFLRLSVADLKKESDPGIKL